MRDWRGTRPLGIHVGKKQPHLFHHFLRRQKLHFSCLDLSVDFRGLIQHQSEKSHIIRFDRADQLRRFHRMLPLALPAPKTGNQCNGRTDPAAAQFLSRFDDFFSGHAFIDPFQRHRIAGFRSPYKPCPVLPMASDFNSSSDFSKYLPGVPLGSHPLCGGEFFPDKIQNIQQIRRPDDKRVSVRQENPADPIAICVISHLEIFQYLFFLSYPELFIFIHGAESATYCEHSRLSPARSDSGLAGGSVYQSFVSQFSYLSFH